MDRKIDIFKENDIPVGVKVWEESVRKTHHFLKEADINYLKPFVKDIFLQIEKVVCMRDDNGSVIAFMGVENEKIEMLFIHPSYIGKGLGRKLIRHAIDTLCAKYVDVNEQNEKAKGFYEHMGFTTISRSEIDGMGNPFPILHMKLLSNPKQHRY